MNEIANIDNRVKGQFPLSIATSLAFEGLFGIMQETENPKNPPLNTFKHVWINIRTLFRNIHGSVDKEIESQLLPGDYSNAIIEEMSIINGILNDKNPNIKIHYYVCTYQTLSRIYPFAVFKEVKTDKQKEYAALENSMLGILFKHFGNSDSNVHIFDTFIIAPVSHILLLTHYPFDLINVKGGDHVALLESHTGVVKLKPQWNTKLNTRDYIRLPFDRMTVQLFGDSGGLLKPYPRDFRDKLLKLASEKKWTSETTKDRILQSIRDLHDPIFEASIKRLY